MTDRAMHVEAFGRVLTDAGSIPAASTSFKTNFLNALIILHLCFFVLKNPKTSENP